MRKSSTLVSAAFLMATSAIGPGFLTQTTVLTQKLGYSFAFGIFLSIIIDVIAQTSIWRILGFSKLRATQFGNQVFPYFGSCIAVIVALGGFVFNIGNVSGAGLGTEAAFGFSTKIGALISSLFVLLIFNSKKSLQLLDYVVKVLGIIMLILIISMVFLVKIDFGLLIKNTFIPEKIDVKAILTIIGGTIGGYISFAGIHRLIEAGTSGSENLKEISKSASLGIILTGICRIFLFIGTLGVLVAGNTLTEENPSSSVFLFLFGDYGKIMFGLMIWFAAVTSLIGATYTSVSFLIDISPVFETYKKAITVFFISMPTFFFMAYGKPIKILVYAGYFNAFVLPFALIMVLLGLRKSFMKTYKHPKILLFGSISIIIVMLYYSIVSLF